MDVVERARTPLVHYLAGARDANQTQGNPAASAQNWPLVTDKGGDEFDGNIMRPCVFACACAYRGGRKRSVKIRTLFFFYMNLNFGNVCRIVYLDIINSVF